MNQGGEIPRQSSIQWEMDIRMRIFGKLFKRSETKQKCITLAKKQMNTERSQQYCTKKD